MVGCSPQPEIKPHQKEASELIWYDFLGQRSSIPYIDWINPPDPALNCALRPDGLFYGWMTKMGCVAGLSSDGYAEMVWFGSLAQSGFAHEFIHIALKNMGRDPDAEHLGPMFAGDTAMVYRINSELRRLGY